MMHRRPRRSRSRGPKFARHLGGSGGEATRARPLDPSPVQAARQPSLQPRGLGSLIEGRRKDMFRPSVDGARAGALRDLGKLFFDLAGSPLAEVRLY